MDAMSDTGVVEALKVGPALVRSRRIGPIAPRESGLRNDQGRMLGHPHRHRRRAGVSVDQPCEAG